MHRRGFLATPLAAFQLAAAETSDDRVYALGDGIPLLPQEYAQLLARLAKPDSLTADEYSRGGVVEQLETRMASMLGKETAVWLPTGTLANHLAVRALAGTRRRVVVQAESHLYNDCGDCAQTLSGLNLVGLGAGRATFPLDEVERAANVGLLGGVPSGIGAIQIETPVRRRQGERFDFEAMKKISTWARDRKIGLHLDGARLFLENAYTSRPVKDYAALFDTVYVSLYKYFNAASGAMLAGPKALLGDLFNTRRMFGAGLPAVWPFAAVALHYLDGFEKRFKAAVDTSEAVIKTLGTDANFEIERVANGTNIFHLRVNGVNAPIYQNRLENAGIAAQTPDGQVFAIHVNETWGRASATEIIARFRKALG